MTNVTNNKPLRVSDAEGPRPYINVPLTQLDGVRRLLDGRGIRYSVDETAISLNGGPYFIVVDLGRGGDANVVQEILDGAT